MNETVKIETRSEVLAAISKAMAGIKKVARDGKNTHDNYNFASIDDFLAMANPICADAGLLFHMDESSREDFMRKGKYGESAWMRQSFSITVYHTSGQSLPPVTRSVEVLRNGAQAYGSAQSYALKQFLRSLLLIPTGDKDDADFNATDAGEIVKLSPPSPKDDGAHAIASAIKAIERETDMGSLGAFWADLVRTSTAAKDKSVIAAKDKRKAELSAKDDLGSDEIPY
jgi:hypothetical protein